MQIYLESASKVALTSDPASFIEFNVLIEEQLCSEGQECTSDTLVAKPYFDTDNLDVTFNVLYGEAWSHELPPGAHEADTDPN